MQESLTKPRCTITHTKQRITVNCLVSPKQIELHSKETELTLWATLFQPETRFFALLHLMQPTHSLLFLGEDFASFSGTRAEFEEVETKEQCSDSRLMEG